MNDKRIGIIGTGKVGANLGYWLACAGHRVFKLYDDGIPEERLRWLAGHCNAGVAESIARMLAECEIIFLTVPDDAMVAILERIAEVPRRRVRFMFHCSGIVESRVLGLGGTDYAAASFHPFAPIAPLDLARNPFEDVVFGIEGDPGALAVGRRLIHSLGGTCRIIDPEKKPLYHAAGTFGSNFLYAIANTAQRYLEMTGFPPGDAHAAISTLMSKSLSNYMSQGPGAITGPVSRGDIGTVKSHLAYIEDTDRELYIAASRILARMAGTAEIFASILDTKDGGE